MEQAACEINGCIEIAESEWHIFGPDGCEVGEPARRCRIHEEQWRATQLGVCFTAVDVVVGPDGRFDVRA